MIKILLKKQVAEWLAFLTVNRKNGSSRSKGIIAAYCLLFVYVIAVFGFMFYSLAESLIMPLSFVGNEWLAFSLMAMIAVAFGIFTGIFTAYSSIYEPKDNELLLSMPIKPFHILFARIINCYASAFFVQSMVLIPAAVAYFMFKSPSVGFVAVFVLSLFLLPLLTVTVSCLLGYLLALVMARVTNKSLVTTLLSLGFLVAYYYVYFQGQKYLNYVLNHSEEVGTTVRTVFYPFYCFGNALFGDYLCLLLLVLVLALPFAGVCALLTKSFIKLATSKKGSARKVYVAETAKVKSPFTALFKKEISRFLRTSVYLLNCGLASLLMIVGTVFLLVKSEDVKNLGTAFVAMLGDSTVTLILCGALGFLISMNLITAPSISLEGRYISTLKSLPIKGFTMLSAKLALHMLFTAVPALVAAVTVVVLVPINLTCSMLLLAFSLIFPLFTGCLGLFVNLKLPSFTWTNETVAVKQSASVLISMFSSMAPLLAGVVLLVFGDGVLSPSAVLMGGAALVTVLASALLILLKINADKWISAL